ncbi:SpoIID/LytB domain-containing protein [Thermosulfurimonas dismutans]|uniref:Sporulation stage II protein D amidase enhancer LytB N-terminal domain-containing protein n=1 Tax=Thermosulfurimonas dismutans TaxID=999894 RepID=A0A179D4N8_9BACT|nr:SpoIID/LytB domain-containing protein [Thermosulfurimonas dismutans]OAQ20933.1 hypothetical protein TDIS_0859 [Thermosulfurimonas dismutans]
MMVRTRNFFLVVVWVILVVNLWRGYSLAQVDLETERLARWYLNYASYLIDVGKYMEALENYETAYEISRRRATRAEALLSKAALLSTFLDAPEEALKVYQQIEKEYPEKEEVALYREGLLLFDLGRKEEARLVLEKYLKFYPEGRFRFQAEALLKRLLIIPTPPPPEIKVVRPRVRVRLAKGIKEILIKGTPVCNEILGCNEAFLVRAIGRELCIGDKRVGVSRLCFRGSGPLKVESPRKKRVRGKVCVEIYQGKLLVINILDIEEYLLSVVPSESPASWPLETLKAQAVAARTYAYYQLLHRKNKPYDLVDYEGDQAYGGVDKEHPRSTRAVRETEGEVLVYKNRPILAMYMANSGGYTADPKAVFSLSKPYLRAQPDPESLKGKMARWRRVFNIKEVEERLNRIGIKVIGLTAIEPVEKGPSGRVIKIKLIARNGVKVLRTRTTLRRALKLPDILLSSIKKNGDQFIFEGGGFGHGVGYSQWGAAFMGKKYTYREILFYYYPGTEIKKLW